MLFVNYLNKKRKRKLKSWPRMVGKLWGVALLQAVAGGLTRAPVKVAQSRLSHGAGAGQGAAGLYTAGPGSLPGRCSRCCLGFLTAW